MTSISVAQNTQRSQSQSQVKRPAIFAYGLVKTTRDGIEVTTLGYGRSDKFVLASKRHDDVDSVYQHCGEVVLSVEG